MKSTIKILYYKKNFLQTYSIKNIFTKKLI